MTTKITKDTKISKKLKVERREGVKSDNWEYGLRIEDMLSEPLTDVRGLDIMEKSAKEGK